MSTVKHSLQSQHTPNLTSASTDEHQSSEATGRILQYYFQR